MGNIIKAEELCRQDKDNICIIDIMPSAENSISNQIDAAEPNPEEIAKMIIEQAELDAQSILSSARDAAGSIRDEAYQSGYDKGYEEVQRDKQFYAERFSQLELELIEQFQKAWDDIEPEVVMLSVDIARKIVKREVDSNDGFVLTTVREALRQLRDRQDIKIWVNPQDYELALSSKDDIKSYCDGIRSMEIVENRRTGRGGCLIESRNGHLDARLETQFQVVENAMMEAIRDGKNDDLNES